MSNPETGNSSAPGSVAEACRLVRIGEPPLMIICSNSVESLSTNARELVRELRAAGARAEFHSPDGADTILQSSNRLLADIPLDALMSKEEQAVLRLLVVDNGERLSDAETASLARVANGLRGSALRVVVLVRHAPERLGDLPVARLGDLSVIWGLDPSPRMSSSALPSLKVPAAVSTDPALTDQITPERAAPKTSAPNIVVGKAKPAEPAEIRDVLVELARERADGRSVNVTARARQFLLWIAGVVVIGIVTAVIAVNLQWRADSTEKQRFVFDCGLHPDQESAETLMSRLGRSVPTRVRKQSGGYRLEVGPFEGRTAADMARPQVWRLGACRASPVAVRDERSVSTRSGG